MRIDHLALTAFGPFTDQQLDLSGGAPGGVHVVFGPNEAGKSTALRAVTALLFGIPTRTQDDHVHPYSRLRLSARLTHEGRTLALTRIKRRKDDLLDAEGRPLDPARLAELLSHLDQRTFTSRFGLGQSELEAGAEALLGGGEEGLFAAGAAGAVVRQVLDELSREADELFLPRGKVPRLNQALSAYGEAQKIAKQLVRPPERWLEQRQAAEAAVAQVDALKQRRASVRAAHVHQTRLLSLLSDLGRLEQVEAQLAALQDVPRLPEDAARQREVVQRLLHEVGYQAEHLEQEAERRVARLAELPDPGPLSDVADEFLALRDGLGRARTAQKDLPKLVARRRGVEQAVARVLQGLGYDAADGDVLLQARRLLPDTRREKRIQGLIAERASVDKELELARREAREAEQEIAEVNALGVGDSKPLAGLVAALENARAQRPTLERLTELGERIAARGVAIDALRARLGLAGNAGIVEERVPAIAEVRQGAERWRALEVQLERLRDEVTELDAQLASERGKLLALRAREDLPSEQKLAEARVRRDEALARVGEAAGPTPTALLALVREADDVADRLRREASRVAVASGLEQVLEGLGARRQVKARHVKQAAEELVHHRERIVQALHAACPPSEETAEVPLTASAYQTRGEALFELASLGREQAEALAVRSASANVVEGAGTELRRAVLALGQEPLPDTLGFAGAIHFVEALLEEQRRQQEQVRDRRARLTHATRRARAAGERVGLAQKRLSSWETDFREVARGLVVGQVPTVALAQDVLADLAQLRDILSDARGLENRIEGIERDAAAFRQDIRRWTARHANDLADDDPIEAGELLLERMASARRVAEERKQVLQELETTQAQLREAQARLRSGRAQLDDLLRAARAATVDDLSEVEAQSRRAVRLDEEREQIVKNLLQKSVGRPLAELREEARGVSYHELSARTEELEEERDELDEQLRDAEQNAASLAAGLERYSSEDVALARQQAVLRGSAARRMLREYLTLSLARALLRGQISRYADRFAGPIAQRASQLFQALTRGRYSRLGIGVGERTIRLVRGTDEIEVDQLSRGTRAQLYLALRLASLEAHFERHPAIPLVLDDLLVDFDDERAQAAFELLGQLGQRVQVLYFTHLGRDVEAARRGVSSEVLFEHTLGA